MPKGETNHRNVPIFWEDEGPTDSASRMLAAMDKGKVYTLAQIAKATGYERSCVSRTMDTLKKGGKVRRGEQVIAGKRTAVFMCK